MAEFFIGREFATSMSGKLTFSLFAIQDPSRRRTRRRVRAVIFRGATRTDSRRMTTARGVLVGVGSTAGVDTRRCRARPRRSAHVSSHHLSRFTRWRMSPGERRAEGARGDDTVPHATFTPFVNAVGAGGGTILLLSVHSKQPYGLQVGVVGDADVFGAWEPEDGFRLKWTEGNIWTGRVGSRPARRRWSTSS